MKPKKVKKRNKRKNQDTLKVDHSFGEMMQIVVDEAEIKGKKTK